MEQLAEILSKFDPIDLAAGVGALQLLPENADRLLRLETIAGIAAANPLPADFRPPIPGDRWMDLVQHADLGETIRREDPVQLSFHRVV